MIATDVALETENKLEALRKDLIVNFENRLAFTQAQEKQNREDREAELKLANEEMLQTALKAQQKQLEQKFDAILSQQTKEFAKQIENLGIKVNNLTTQQTKTATAVAEQANDLLRARTETTAATATAGEYASNLCDEIKSDHAGVRNHLRELEERLNLQQKQLTNQELNLFELKQSASAETISKVSEEIGSSCAKQAQIRVENKLSELGASVSEELAKRPTRAEVQDSVREAGGAVRGDLQLELVKIRKDQELLLKVGGGYVVVRYVCNCKRVFLIGRVFLSIVAMCC